MAKRRCIPTPAEKAVVDKVLAEFEIQQKAKEAARIASEEQNARDFQAMMERAIIERRYTKTLH